MSLDVGGDNCHIVLSCSPVEDQKIWYNEYKFWRCNSDTKHNYLKKISLIFYWMCV